MVGFLNWRPMPIRRRTLIAFSLAVICIAILGSLKFDVDGTDSYYRRNPDAQIEFKYASRRLNEIGAVLLWGVHDMGGTYRLLDENGLSHETGKFRLLMDESGYVSGYALTNADGHRRVWENSFGYYLSDHAGNSWEPKSGAPIRMYQGLVGDLVSLF